MADVPVIKVRIDPSLTARLSGPVPLRYADGPSRDPGLPGHVRAASAVRRWGRRLVVVQDDVNMLALGTDGGEFEALLLPAGQGGGRCFGHDPDGKRRKMDLEAGVILPDGRLLAFGSGSLPTRERLVLVQPSGRVDLVEAGDLYRLLRETKDFSGSELNVEGALVVGDALRLFQRGNGAPGGGLRPVDATGDLPLRAFLEWLDGGDSPLGLERVRQYDLGTVGGVRYGFTDAALLPDGRTAFIACAEDSPDTVQDGAVMGARFGLIEGDDVRVTDIVDEAGRPVDLKFEGIEHGGGPSGSFLLVADMDDPDKPAVMGRLEVTGL